jgi:hypothetical protein
MAATDVSLRSREVLSGHINDYARLSREVLAG